MTNDTVCRQIFCSKSLNILLIFGIPWSRNTYEAIQKATFPCAEMLNALQLPFGFLTSVLSGQNTKYSLLYLWHGIEHTIYSLLNWAILLCDVIPDVKNWVNCAVLTGNSAGLTTLSSRLSHRELRISLRESHIQFSFSCRFFYSVKLRSLTQSVWGPLETFFNSLAGFEVFVRRVIPPGAGRWCICPVLWTCLIY